MSVTSVTLSAEEVQAVLNQLEHITVRELNENPTLNCAIQKLSGQYNYPAYAGGMGMGMGDVSDSKRMYVLESESKIDLIKAVRNILGVPLPEAKRIAEAGTISGGSDIPTTYSVTISTDDSLNCVREFAGCTVTVYGPNVC